MKKIISILVLFLTLHAFELISPDIKYQISTKQVYYKCGGKNISPKLLWDNFPKNTKSFAITMFDPDAPTDHGWWHWMVVNIPKNIHMFPRNAGNPKSKYFTLGLQTINDYKEIGYGGPCPPPGKPHRYIITVYALNIKKINVPININPQILYKIILAHTIQKASIEGIYERKSFLFKLFNKNF